MWPNPTRPKINMKLWTRPILTHWCATFSYRISGVKNMLILFWSRKKLQTIRKHTLFLKSVTKLYAYIVCVLLTCCYRERRHCSNHLHSYQSLWLMFVAGFSKQSQWAINLHKRGIVSTLGTVHSKPLVHSLSFVASSTADVVDAERRC